MIKLDRNKIYSRCHFAIALIAVQLWKPLKIFLLSNVSSFHLFIKWGCEVGIKNWSATCLMVVVCAHFPFFLPPPLGMLNSQAPLNSLKENSFYQSFFFFFFHLKHKFLRRSKKYQLESPHYLSFQQYTISCLTKYEVVLSKLCVPDLLVQCGAMIEVNIGQITCTEHGSLHLHNKIRHY